jgi:aspartate ammonia-lyase
MDETVGTVTALVPVIGYERATALADEAYRSGKGLIQVLREKKVLTEAQIKDLLDPTKLANLDRSKYRSATQRAARPSPARHR